MSITFRCPCGESLAAEAEHAGMPVQCPTCEKVLTVPAAGSSAPPPPPRKMARLADEEDDRPKKRKKKRRNYGADDEPEHVRRLMARANADLDEEEARHRREGGGIAFTPGILLGLGLFVGGLALFGVLLLVGVCSIWPLVVAGIGLVRCVLAFLGKGVD